MRKTWKTCARVPTRCSWRCGCVRQCQSMPHSPHSVFAKKYFITRPGTVFCCWKPLVCDHQTQDLKLLLHTIYVASFFIHLIWHFIGKDCNSYFSLVGGVPIKLHIFSFRWWILMTQAIWTKIKKQTLLPFFPFSSSQAVHNAISDVQIRFSQNILSSLSFENENWTVSKLNLGAPELN